MGYSFNGTTKIITLTPGTTEFAATDLYSRWKDWALTDDNLMFAPAMYATGGDSLGGGLSIAAYVVLMNGWLIKPAAGTYGLTVTGNLVGEDGASPFTLPDSGVVTIRQLVTGNALGVATSGSTLTAGQIWGHDTAVLLMNYVLRMVKTTTNKREIKKIDGAWTLLVYDDDGETAILQKALKDVGGANIADLVAGVLALEEASSV